MLLLFAFFDWPCLGLFVFWFASSWLGLGRFVLSCFRFALHGRARPFLGGALDPVIRKDFLFISKLFKDDHELTPEEMSTMVDVRAEGCGTRRWFLQQFEIGFAVLFRSHQRGPREAAVLFP